MGERRWRIIWARWPQTSQRHSSAGRQPPGLLRCGGLCPVEPASCPAGRPASHIWQPLGKASCWPSGEWQILELTAGGSRWGERSWTWEPTHGFCSLEDEAFLGLASGCAPGRGLSSARPGKWRRLSAGAPHRATLPTQLLLCSQAARYSPFLPGRAPNHSTWEERNPASDGKQQLGKG